MRRAWKWTKHQVDKLKEVKKILIELSDYAPLTLRQIYYQLVGKGHIENRDSQYIMLSGLLKWARIDGYIEWDDIEDRVRVYDEIWNFDDSGSFILDEQDRFLEGYQRDFQQSQPSHIEVWIEKDALSSIFTKTCRPYGISTVVCRGFSSVSFLHQFQDRLVKHEGQEPVMLYFGDFDPSGMEMLESMKTTLEDELGVNGITFKRIALSQDDVITYSLPHNPKALKKKDTRAKKHVEAYGEMAVEIDALRPDVLVEKIEEAIVNELDVGAYNQEIQSYKAELAELAGLKKKA